MFAKSAAEGSTWACNLNGKLETFTGICKGQITTQKSGNQGFGYDPIFKPTGFEQTFAEMDLTLKNTIGHRGKAVTQLVIFLNNSKRKNPIKIRASTARPQPSSTRRRGAPPRMDKPDNRETRRHQAKA